MGMCERTEPSKKELIGITVVQETRSIVSETDEALTNLEIRLSSYLAPPEDDPEPAKITGSSLANNNGIFVNEIMTTNELLKEHLYRMRKLAEALEI